MNGVFGGQKVRFDPWSPEYGASLMSPQEMEGSLLSKVRVDTSVEMPDEEWKAVYCDPAKSDLNPVAFVDGVRRMESNLVFEQEDRFAYGGFGSCAAGALVLSPGRMNSIDIALAACSVQRFLFAPENSDAREVLEIPQNYPPGSTIPHQIIAVDGNEPQEPLARLQQLMRQEESLVAEQLTVEQCSLVVADGPLSLPLIRPGIAGFIKSLHSFYIAPGLFPVLTGLRKHERTPLFQLSKEDTMERYSAYVRIQEPRAQDTVLAGLARFEVSGGEGMEAARAILDRCAAMVPLFASPYGRDPRAPQNLLPISVLEMELRRRLGSREILNRLYLEWLS